MFCSTKRLARGPAARPRCIPPAAGSSRALSPFQSQKTVSPVNHSRETSLSLHPSILSGRSGAYRRPLNPTRRTWRYASPPAPHHAQPTGRLIPDQGSVPATPDAPMTISWRPGRELSRSSSLEPSHRAGVFRPHASLAILRGLNSAFAGASSEQEYAQEVRARLCCCLLIYGVRLLQIHKLVRSPSDHHARSATRHPTAWFEQNSKY